MRAATKRRPQKLTKAQKTAGLKHGWRSGLEERVAASLEQRGAAFEYEGERIFYNRKPSTYTPDFRLANGIIVETKGRFISSDRAKHLLIKQQHDLDIRFVFSNPNARLNKASKTTYAMWCERHGFLYAKGDVPDGWLQEAGEN